MFEDAIEPVLEVVVVRYAAHSPPTCSFREKRGALRRDDQVLVVRLRRRVVFLAAFLQSREHDRTPDVQLNGGVCVEGVVERQTALDEVVDDVLDLACAEGGVLGAE